ncbi:transglutaminaseTgpA domain-containing protein [Psychrobacter submarinus]|uniref:transglutaminase family protein n=1 Tax=Psychrobacter submarinus TaxID=154108 RepID=UPI003F69CD15
MSLLKRNAKQSSSAKAYSNAKPDTRRTSITAIDDSDVSFEKLAYGQLASTRLPDRQRHDKPASISNRYQRLLSLPAYYWVLIAQLFVILPHAAYLPLWLIGFAIITIIAQLPSIKAKFKPTRLKRLYQVMQMLGFLLGLAGLSLTYGAAFGLDMGVGFLVLCLVSKLWELYKRRDAYVVLNLSLFVIAGLFLLDQGLVTTLQAVAATIIVLLAFITLNDDSNTSGDGRMRTLGVLGVSALPLLVVLFLFFPRLPPLWSVQLSSSQATTGVSDSMSPGDIASLSQSTELAFRVEFAQARPAQSELYWRGLVFSDFDGVTWRPNRRVQQQWQPGRQPPNWLARSLATATTKTEPKSYEITLEPTQQQWLFGLDYPLPQNKDTRLTSDFTLIKEEPVSEQLRYEVLRYAPMQIDPILDEVSRAANLTLPSAGNLQTQNLAKQLFAQSGSDPERYIQAIQRWINQTEFRYTLSPPPLDEDRIDSFLFETKAGFCEHYSSSFTFMMRAVGIPARVVAGYQGGEMSRGGNVWEVRQMDAHAWSEVWLEGQGWVRVDPTAFVAPERVEQGMDALTQSRGASLFGEGAAAQVSYQQYQMLQALRRLSDQASYYWQKDVVGYDQDKQAGSLLKWFNIRSISEQIAWLAASAITVISLLVFMIWYRRRKQWHPADRPLIKLSSKVAKNDRALSRHDNEGALAWLKRLENSQAHGLNGEGLQEVSRHYRQLRYGRLSDADTQSPEYQQVLKELKRSVSQLL